MADQTQTIVLKTFDDDIHVYGTDITHTFRDAVINAALWVNATYLCGVKYFYDPALDVWMNFDDWFAKKPINGVALTNGDRVYCADATGYREEIEKERNRLHDNHQVDVWVGRERND